VVADVVHKCCLNFDSGVLDNLDETRSMIVMQVGANCSPELGPAALEKEIQNLIGGGTRTTVNQNPVSFPIFVFGDDNAIGVAEGEHVDFNSIENCWWWEKR
jgi:hypothetical protein